MTTQATPVKTSKRAKPTMSHRELLLSQLRAEARTLLREVRQQEREEQKRREAERTAKREYFFQRFIALRDEHWIELERLLGRETLEALNVAAQVFDEANYLSESDQWPVFEFRYGDHEDVWRIELDPHECLFTVTAPGYQPASITYYTDFGAPRFMLLLRLAEYDEDLEANRTADIQSFAL